MKLSRVLLSVDGVARRKIELVLTGRGLAVKPTLSAVNRASPFRTNPTGNLLNDKSEPIAITVASAWVKEYCAVQPIANANAVCTISVHAMLLFAALPSIRACLRIAPLATLALSTATLV